MKTGEQIRMVVGEKESFLDPMIRELNSLGNAELLISRNMVLSHLYGFFEEFPMPAWIKMKSGYMLKVNKAYEAEFGISAATYNIDADHWSEEDVESYKKYDLSVIEQGKAVHSLMPFSHPNVDFPTLAFTMKWPLSLEIIKRDGIVSRTTAIAGVILGICRSPEKLKSGDVLMNMVASGDTMWEIAEA